MQIPTGAEACDFVVELLRAPPDALRCFQPAYKYPPFSSG